MTKLNAYLFLLTFVFCHTYGQSNIYSVQKKEYTKKINLEDILKPTSTSKNEADASLEIGGLIMDETKTKGGGDFYEYFYNNWKEPFGHKKHSITIKEMPLRMSTTQIQVLIDNEHIVFQSALQQRYDVVVETSEMAIRQLNEFVINYDRIVKDLGGVDQQGNGIF